MTAFALEHRPALPIQARSLRKLLGRLARAIDTVVSAKAARTVPEWRMHEVQGAINRHLGLIRAAELRRQKELPTSSPIA